MQSWFHAIRPGSVLNTEDEYHDVTHNELDDIVCEPCHNESEEGIKAKAKRIIDEPIAE